MERYKYREAVRADVSAWLEENRDKDELKAALTDNFDGVMHDLYDELFCEDSVTGNASGSYFCNAWRAEDCLCHNFDLLDEACREFGCQPKLNDPEACDVTIRCYLLDECLQAVLEEIKNG